MVINNLYIFRVRTLPKETDSPLVIYSDAILAFTISLQSFQSIRRRQTQITQLDRRIDRVKFHECPFLNVSRESLSESPMKNSFGVATAKRLDHT
jgi:hypothetical protein